MAFSTVTLTGTYKKLDGTAESGTVRIAPTTSPVIDATGSVVLAGSLATAPIRTQPRTKRSPTRSRSPLSAWPDPASPATEGVTMRKYYTELVDRAVKSAAQGAVLAIGSESLQANAFAVDWSTAAGFALGAAVLSLLTNLGQRGLTGRRDTE